jgi:hypothetical protein
VLRAARRPLPPGRSAGIFAAMSTLTEIESAIDHLPAPQLEELAAWLEQRRLRRASTTSAVEPDFLGRAKAIWGEMPAGKPLSELVAEARS